jgi:hypothetical protein
MQNTFSIWGYLGELELQERPTGVLLEARFEQETYRC